MGDSGRWQVLVVMVEVMVVMVMSQAGGAQAQQMPENCNVGRSDVDTTKADVYCDCMQQLTQMNLPISQLTINQTSCPGSALELSWPDLETLVAPESLTLIGAYIVFDTIPTERTWNPSIVQLTFNNCSFDTIPSNAFRGMHSLQKISFTNMITEGIDVDAFSSLKGLVSVEIAKSSINIIRSRAFNSLPAINDVTFSECSIGVMENEAISIQRENNAINRCSSTGRSIDNSTNAISGIMGRQFGSMDNLTLPEYGSRLFFFKNSIGEVRSKAISSETFGFLILGGNHIQRLEPEAFDMELYNECEISAALFVGNNISTLQSRAFAGLRGRDGVAYQTFIALSNNTFEVVAERGFLLDENLSIFSVDENHFVCNCDRFDWILSDQNSESQRELEKELVLKATCVDGTNFISFTSSCTDHGSPSFTTTQAPSSSSTDDTTYTSARPPFTTIAPVPTGGAKSQTASFGTLTATVLTLVLGKALA